MSDREQLKNSRNVVSEDVSRTELLEREPGEVEAKLRQWFEKLHEIRDDDIADVQPVLIFCLGEVRVKNNGNVLSNHK
jgi:hypothetical protein